mgnify:CR=1 FL=1
MSMNKIIENACYEIAEQYHIDSNELLNHIKTKYISKNKEVTISTIRHIAEKISKKGNK